MPEKNDNVNHPKHYTSHPSGVECIEITEHYNFTIGNAIKYLWRQGLKSEGNLDPVEKQIEDCKKAVWYINREIKNLTEGVYNGKVQEQNESMAQSSGTDQSGGRQASLWPALQVQPHSDGKVSFPFGSCTVGQSWTSKGSENYRIKCA